MFVIRNVFKCKPGQAKRVVERLQAATALMEGMKQRILIDQIADFWTVVLEIEAETLDAYEKQYHEYGQRADVQKAMSGYLDAVESGYRQVFRVV